MKSIFSPCKKVDLKEQKASNCAILYFSFSGTSTTISKFSTIGPCLPDYWSKRMEKEE